MNGLFITGTDTGVGKTVVTAAITRTLRANGHDVAAIKPLATGCHRENGRWVNEDILALAAASGRDAGDVMRWGFAEPVAPCVVAKRYDVRWKLDDLVGEVERHIRSDRRLLVEGVGGLLCPLTEELTVADWIAALRMPMIVVARRALGTLNHTLMTLEVARYRGLDVRGVVVSETKPVEGWAEESNVEELRCRIAVPLLAVVPHHVSNHEPVRIDEVDWESLMRSRA